MRSASQIAFMTVLAGLAQLGMSADTPGEIFQRRILPLAKAEQPSSCIECHVAGVDLRQYIRADAPATFAALRQAGLVNLDQPEKSKLLEFIARAPQQGDPVLAKVREAELAAFGEWIKSAANDPKMRAANGDGQPIGPTLPVEIVRHGRKDRVLQSFVENIWIERERCAGCHSPDKNQRLIEKHGEHISWIVPGDPGATLAKIVDHALIDVDAPDKSLILQKPLMEVEHGGHIKFPRGSRTDKQFRDFLHDYAATVKSRYRTAADLPRLSKRFIVPSAQHLRITGVPAQFAGKLGKVEFFAPAADGKWSEQPAAMMDGMIHPKNGQFQSVVFTYRDREGEQPTISSERPQLPGGKYLARLYVDRADRVREKRDDSWGPADLVAEIEFDGPWPPGYSPPRILVFPAGGDSTSTSR